MTRLTDEELVHLFRTRREDPSVTAAMEEMSKARADAWHRIERGNRRTLILANCAIALGLLTIVLWIVNWPQ